MSDNTVRDPESLGEAFKNGYDSIFGKQWPIWVGGILFGMINVFMFAFGILLGAGFSVRLFIFNYSF